MQERPEPPLFGLEGQGDAETQATRTTPNRAGYQEGAAAPRVFAKTGSLALQNTQTSVQPRRDSKSQNNGAGAFTISREKPGPVADHATEDDRKLLQRQQRSSRFGRADLCHVQGREHATARKLTKDKEAPLRQTFFGRYVERTVEAIPQRANSETTDGPAGCDLRQRFRPCLQGRTYAEDSFIESKVSRWPVGLLQKGKPACEHKEEKHKTHTHHTRTRWPTASKPYPQAHPRRARQTDSPAQVPPLNGWMSVPSISSPATENWKKNGGGVAGVTYS